MKTGINICIILMFFFTSCKNKIEAEKFVKKVQTEAKYNDSKTVGVYNLKLSYKPCEYLALQELSNSQSLTERKKQFEKNLQGFSNGVYFDFSIALANGEKLIPAIANNQEEYSFLVGELNYLIQNDLYILNAGKDTIKAIACNYSNTFGNSNDIKLTYCFPKESLQKKGDGGLKIEYKDAAFGMDQKIDFDLELNELINEKISIKEFQ